MANIRTLGALPILILPLSQCTTITHRESVGMRQHAIDYYNAQVMDNLISGSKGRLILHVNIDSLTTEVSASNTSSLNAGRTSVEGSEISDTPLTLSKIADSVTKPLSIGNTSVVGGKLTSLAKPSSDYKIYESYLRFLTLKKGDKSLFRDLNGETLTYNPAEGSFAIREITSRQSILDGSYVEGTVTRSGNRFYYVPIEFSQAYFELLLAVTGKLDPSGSQSTPDSSKTSSRFEIPGPIKSMDNLLEEKVRDSQLSNEID